MTIGTAGTSTTSNLTACFAPGSYMQPNGVAQSFVEADSDIVGINSIIRDDQYHGVGNQVVGSSTPYPVPTGGWSRQGQLYIPNRGWLKVLPGDLVCVDANGWPILVSAFSILTGGWTKTAT